METTPLTVFREMRLFIIVWAGQIVALIGSNITGFALDVLVYERTGSITQFALVTLSNTLPFVLLAPIAGLLVDRWDRRWVMIFSDFFASWGTVAIALLFFFHRLEIWHIYLANTFTSIFLAFHVPAFFSSVTQLVPKQHLGRANGLLSLLSGIPRIIAPPIAGVLLETVHLEGIIIFHLFTVVVGILPLVLLQLPKFNAPIIATPKSSFFQEAIYGFTYLTTRPGLLGVLILFGSCVFLAGGVQVIITPLILTLASVNILAIILSILGVAILTGSLVIVIWGGLERNMNTIYLCMLLGGVTITVAGIQSSLIVFTVNLFLFFLIRPFISSSIQSILQTKVEPSVQGRVFSIKGAVEAAALPIGYVTIGLLAEKVFEPLMANDGALVGSIGQIIGVGPGRGMGLLLIIMGSLSILQTCIAYFYPRLRFVEDELPDVMPDAVAMATPAAGIATDIMPSTNNTITSPS